MQQFDSTTFRYPGYLRPLRCRRHNPRTIILQGMVGDEIFEGVRRAHSFYESDLLERIAFLMGGRVDVIVDVGANIGNHALYFSKVLGAKVICVEPNPVALDLLRKNLAGNDVNGQVTIVQAAASDHSGVLQLVSAPVSNLGMARVKEGGGDGAVKVAARTLDDIVSSALQKGNSRVSLIKIDVEGFEERVLQGARKTMERHRPMIVVEAATTESHRSIETLLSRFGYHCLGPFCATPTYIFCQSNLVCRSAAVWWFLRRVLRYVALLGKRTLPQSA